MHVNAQNRKADRQNGKLILSDSREMKRYLKKITQEIFERNVSNSQKGGETERCQGLFLSFVLCN